MTPRFYSKNWSSPFLVIVILIVVGAVDHMTVAAQQLLPGNITAFADPTASSCSITDQVSGPFTVYVFHTNFSQMQDVYFRVYESPGFHATYLGEWINELVSVGDFRNGIGLFYGAGCPEGPLLLLGTISYQGNGTSEPCSYVDIVGWRASLPLAGDCYSLGEFPAPSLGKLYVNRQSGVCQPWCDVVATTPATWGRVKALYRD